MLEKIQNNLINNSNSLASYLNKVKAIPLLSQEEEKDLIEKLEVNDWSAAQKLILSHLRLVVKIAQNFQSYDLPLQDIISEGNLGLMKAVQKFSPKMGCRLATYASWWIRASIQEYILNSWSIIRIKSKELKEKLFYKWQKTKDFCEDFYSYKALSLDSVREDQTSLVEIITSQKDLDQEEEILEYHDKKKKFAKLKKALTKLSDREKDILYQRCLKSEPTKLATLATKYSITQERIRQIEAAIIKKLNLLCTCE
jgi:RNA polymerase sigma-32 factor